MSKEKQMKLALLAENEGKALASDAERRFEAAACHYEAAGYLNDAARANAYANKMRSNARRL